MFTTQNVIARNGVRESPSRLLASMGSAEPADRDQLNRVFRQRAQRLAQRGRKETIHTQRTPVIVFQLGNERFGIELSQTKQVFPRVPITPLPNTSGLLLGVANLNGSLCSVIDLGKLLNTRAAVSDGGYIVLMHACGKQLGLWAETLEGVCQLDFERLVAVDAATSDPRGGFVRGTTDDRILVLDAMSLIEHVAQQRRRQLTE
jgi:purine-binding chemotaxis protein CheW